MGTCYTGFSQSIESQLSKPSISCRDIHNNSVLLMPKLYGQQDFDSIQFALQYIKDRCGINAETFALQLLHDIQLDQFAIGEPLNASTLGYLQTIANETTNPYLSSRPDYYLGNNNHSPLIKKWAISLKRHASLTATEFFICEVLAGEVKQVNKTIVREQQKLPELYALVRENNAYNRNQFRMLYGVQMGAWMPQGDASILGVHPTMGLVLGGRDSKNELLFNWNFRFINSERSYDVVRNGITYPTNHFFGGYIGVDYARYFIRSYKHELGISLGAGYDGFDVFNTSNEVREELKPTSINCLNINLGSKYHFYLGNFTSFSLHAKYNLVRYRNPGGTSLQGNVFSLDLAFNIHSLPVRRQH